MDETVLANCVPFLKLKSSVGSMHTRIDRLEGAMSDAGRRMQNQGASFESLTKVVTSLGATIKDGFEEVKAMQRNFVQPHPLNASMEPEIHNATDPSAGEGIDKGFRTGRSVRGANPSLTPTDYAVDSMRSIAGIRSLVGDEITSRTAWAICNKDVYLDADVFFEVILDKTMTYRKTDDKDAEEWLMASFAKPNAKPKLRRGKTVVDKVKPFVPLGQILPHLIEALKKRGAAAYFKSIGVVLESLTYDVALAWYKGNAYTKSDAGQKGMRAAMIADYNYLGASSRLEQTRSVGTDSILRCTTGFYALMSSFVRQHLETVLYAGARKPSHVDLTCYASWRTELFRVHGFLPKDKLAFASMCFDDGEDSSRAWLDGDDKNDMYEALYLEQTTAADGAFTLGSAAAANTLAAGNSSTNVSAVASANTVPAGNAAAAANATAAANAVVAANAGAAANYATADHAAATNASTSIRANDQH